MEISVEYSGEVVEDSYEEIEKKEAVVNSFGMVVNSNEGVEEYEVVEDSDEGGEDVQTPATILEHNEIENFDLNKLPIEDDNDEDVLEHNGIEKFDLNKLPIEDDNDEDVEKKKIVRSMLKIYLPYFH